VTTHEVERGGAGGMSLIYCISVALAHLISSMIYTGIHEQGSCSNSTIELCKRVFKGSGFKGACILDA
jgi:hypothetical protein